MGTTGTLRDRAPGGVHIVAVGQRQTVDDAPNVRVVCCPEEKSSVKMTHLVAVMGLSVGSGLAPQGTRAQLRADPHLLAVTTRVAH